VTEKSPPEKLVLALHAEELAVAKRRVTRTVRVTCETRSRDMLVEEDVTSTGIVVERVPMGQFVDAMPPVREEGDITILLVIEEVVVTTRRLRLVEEVRIRRVHTTATHIETVKLREQLVVVTRSDPVILEDAASVAASAHVPATIPPTRNTPMSNETIVAVYDTAAHAELAISDLLAANVPQSSISRHAAEGVYSPEATSVTARRTEDQGGGFWSSLFGGSSDDHAVYDNALQSGGNVVTVAAVPEHDFQAVMTILEKHNPVDIDERAATYSGTAPMAGASSVGTTTAATTTGMTDVGMAGSDLVGSDIRATQPIAATGVTTTAEQGGTIQLAEEQLAVGKRLVNRGGTRVRRYVVETPVEESVTLHEEKVTLERHPVTDGRPVTDADFTDKTIELTETAEEAVVAKTARVVEEVSLGKTATDRSETIRDTIRKEEVEIEQLPGEAVTTATTIDPRAPKI
jgi:uncharacterized protein (TIGR02271 family)